MFCIGHTRELCSVQTALSHLLVWRRQRMLRQCARLSGRIHLPAFIHVYIFYFNCFAQLHWFDCTHTVHVVLCALIDTAAVCAETWDEITGFQIRCDDVPSFLRRWRRVPLTSRDAVSQAARSGTDCSPCPPVTSFPVDKITKTLCILPLLSFMRCSAALYTLRI